MRRIILASFVLLSTACGVEKISGDEGGGACVPAPVQAVFDRRCNMVGCHGALAPTTQVSLSLAPGASDAIIGQQASQAPSSALVEIGNVDGSYLAQKMLQQMPASGDRMPVSADFNDPELQTDIALVVGWIAGAELGACGGGTDSGSSGDTSASTTMTTDATEESSSAGEPVPALCGIEDLDPGAPNPIVAGDVAGQIPTEIGEILANNCGCHYTDNTPFTRNVADYAGMAHMSTLEEWRGPSSDVATTTVIEVAIGWVASETPAVMPPAFGTCDIGDGSGASMPPDERATLLAWLEADGPDGANWPP